MIKIIIADDHQMVTEGLKSLLESDATMKVIATAPNGYELIRMVELVLPDIVLMDIDMPVMNGIEALSAIRKQFPGLKVIVLTMHEEKALVKKMTELGAKGFLFKNSDKVELVNAIKIVNSGGSYFTAALTSKLLESYQTGSPASTHSVLILTDREIEILKLIAAGFSNKEIGDKLYISHRTVDTHRTNLMKKLEVSNIAGLIRFAIKNGYIQ